VQWQSGGHLGVRGSQDDESNMANPLTVNDNADNHLCAGFLKKSSSTLHRNITTEGSGDAWDCNTCIIILPQMSRNCFGLSVCYIVVMFLGQYDEVTEPSREMAVFLRVGKATHWVISIMQQMSTSPSIWRVNSEDSQPCHHDQWPLYQQLRAHWGICSTPLKIAPVAWDLCYGDIRWQTFYYLSSTEGELFSDRRGKTSHIVCRCDLWEVFHRRTAGVPMRMRNDMSDRQLLMEKKRRYRQK